MIKLLLQGVIGFIIIFPLIMIIWRKPDFFFWLFLNLFFDPGGYISGFMGGNIYGRFNISDVSIVFIFITLMSSKVDWKAIYNDQFLLKFIRYFLIFTVYYFVVYGAIAPYLHNDLDYSTFLLKNRTFIYGFIILISVYVFTLQGLNYFYSITLFFGVVSLSLYWITLLTGIHLSPVVMMERYRGSGMMRIAMAGYGIFYLMFPIALITYLISRKIKFVLKYKKWLYYGGILMVLTLLITLTRRTILEIIGTIIIIIFLLSYLFRAAKLSTLLKTFVPTMFVVLALYFTMPKYIDYVARIGEDAILLITTGKDTRGIGDYRVSGTGDLLAVKKSIRNNLWLGNGYTYLYWGDVGYATSPRGNDYARMADAAGEVPIYYIFFSFGLVGVFLIVLLYSVTLKLFFRIVRIIKGEMTKIVNEPLDLIFLIYVLLVISSRFTFNIMSLGGDFGIYGFRTFSVILGIGFALSAKYSNGTNYFSLENKEIKGKPPSSL